MRAFACPIERAYFATLLGNLAYAKPLTGTKAKVLLRFTEEGLRFY
jgi:hypothetical protein